MDDRDSTATNARYKGPSSGGTKKRSLWRAVFVVAIVVFVVSVSALGVIGYSYYQGQQKYGNTAEIANVSDLDEALTSQVSVSEVDDLVTVDWQALLAANPDTVAWIYMPGTAINYPVVRGQDNEHYLTYDFDGSAGWLANYGAIFMDYRNDPYWTDQLYFIYGHHMNDGSMFADLVKLEDQSRFDDCRTIYILSPNGNFKLRTFALVNIAADEEIVVARFADSVQMGEYIQEKIARSLVSADDVPDTSSMGKIFALSTCDSASWGRDILFAYVEDTSVNGLSGNIGIESFDGNTSGFVEELEVDDNEN